MTGVAVVGLALRFPGAESLAELWAHLEGGHCLLSDIPAERWARDRFFGAPGDPGKTYSTRGGFLTDADCFDAAFFGISAREAATMDPQQRLVLELSWAALEDAGYSPAAIRGPRTGVFMGVCHWDYAELMEQHRVPADAWFATGVAWSIIANRVSHHFDLGGPSLTLDTACSSSMVALQYAVRALLDGECDHALAGGVNLCWSPRHFVAFSQSRMLSRGGVGRIFDKDADGYLRGEGAAVLLLKRLDDAVRDGDAIYGVIRGVASNHGGRTSSLTVTNPSALARLVQELYQRLDVAPASVSYIEAHGTGTPVGDPIEVRGLQTAFRALSQRMGGQLAPQTCGLGSIKSNLGHLEGAAGIAGVIKVLAAFQHRRLPGVVNFRTLNPLIDLEDSPFYIVAENRNWEGPAPLRAGVSSHGFGGSNAHALLEEAPFPPAADGDDDETRTWIIPLSARTPEQLRRMTTRLGESLTERLRLRDVAYTLAVGRAELAERVAFVVQGKQDLRRCILAFVAGEADQGRWFQGRATTSGQDPLSPRGETPAELAKAWVHGASVAWPEWFARQPGPRPRRAHLPAYPFERARHWYTPPSGQVRETAGRVHPLVHQNISGRDGIRFRSTFSCDEWFLEEHRVFGWRVLPAMVCPELVRAAMAAAGWPISSETSLHLRELLWARPIRSRGGEEVSIELALRPSAGGAAEFEIRQVNVAEEAAVCWSGRAWIGDDTPPADGPRPEVRGENADDALGSCQRRLSSLGMEYGPSFHVLRALRRDGGECSGRVLSAAGDLALPPALLDGAMQAAACLADDGGTALPLPFSMAALDTYGSLPLAAEIFLRSGEDGTVDVEMLDHSGRTCAVMTGLRFRSAERTSTLWQEEPALAFGETRWVPQPAVAAAAQAAIVLADLPVEACESLAVATGLVVLPLDRPSASPADSYREAMLRTFARVREMVAASHAGPRRLVVFADACWSLSREPLAALLRTATLENPSFQGKLLTLANLEGRSPAALASLLLAEVSEAGWAAEVRFDDDGVRQVRTIEAAAVQGPEAPWRARPEGVYWIAGGVGRIGLHLARHLAEHHGARVVLSGRTRPSAAAGAAIRELRRRGGVVEVLTGDVTDPASVNETVASILASQGRLDGVIHAAGSLHDAWLLQQTTESIETILAPKVRGAVNLDAATAGLDLDLFALFGSVAGVWGQMGQAGYAAANAFLDHFAADRAAKVRRGERRGRSVAVAWGLWADGGMTMTEAAHARMTRERGWKSLPTASALEAFDRICAGSSANVVVVCGSDKRLPPLDPPRDRERASATESGAEAALHTAVPAPQVVREWTIGWLARTLGEVTRMDPRSIRGDERLESYGLDSMVAIEMTDRLQPVVGSVPQTLFFEHLNLDRVAAHLVATYGPALAQAMGAEGTAAEPPAPRPDRAEQGRDAGPASISASGTDRDIAIVGISGRYPAAPTLEELWNLLRNGRHAFTAVPEDRWPQDALYWPDREEIGRSVIRSGTFLTDIDHFDPRYFRIPQREAELMSPEVRLFLQASVHAFEDAGYSRETLRRRCEGDVGVVVGTMSNHYGLYGFANNLARGAPATGSYTGTLPNMVSYFYGLTGPSLFVDTMCSGAATCVHLAVTMLRAGECRMVLAGGVNLLLHPYNLVTSSQEHFTSTKSDVIRSYGLGADGTLLGEGVGAVVLKRLSDALADGDHVYGVIRGSAITNAGDRNGFTVPTPHMQARAVRRALDDAGVDARTVSYVEGHGSGTSLGDPIEIRGLQAAFASDTADRAFCAIGSVKSNLGHLLGPAGLAGLTKILLQLHHQELVPSLHAETLSPEIPFEETAFVVQRALDAWKRPAVMTAEGLREFPRRAGLTSIGAGGVNAHIVLEEAPPPAPRPPEKGPHLFVLSALAATELRELVRRIGAYLADHRDVQLDDLAFTLQVGRNELPVRAAFVAASVPELEHCLLDWLASGTASVRSGDAERHTLEELAATWMAGGTIDWDTLPRRRSPRRVPLLPTYPFRGVRCWVEMEPDAPSLFDRLGARGVHPILGENVSDATGLHYRRTLRHADLPAYTWKKGGKPALLSLALLDAGLALGKVAGLPEPRELRELVWSGSLDGLESLHTRLTVNGDSATVDVEGKRAEEGDVAIAAMRSVRSARLLDAVRIDDHSVVWEAGEELYARLERAGLHYGPALRGIAAFGRREGRMLLRVERPGLRLDSSPRNVVLPPSLLAAIEQAIRFQALDAGIGVHLEPRQIERIRVAGDAEDIRIVQLSLSAEGHTFRADITATDRLGAGRLQIDGLVFAPVELRTNVAGEDVRSTLLRALSDVSGFSEEELDPEATFQDLGLDSIGLTALATKAARSLDVPLDPPVLFEAPTVAALARYVSQRWPHAAQRPAVTTASTGAAEGDAGMGDGIAIIGAAGRWPGADDLETLWKRLVAGAYLIRPYPPARLSAAWRAQVLGADFPHYAGTLDDAGRFDADFFGISPREAQSMDPQHRWALEAAWASIEHAGYAPSEIPVETGVFIGVTGHDYSTLLTRADVNAGAYTSSGNVHAMVANRISFVLDVRGPSEAIDTACSSSLVAVHRAAESLRAGRCDMALAGGVNALLAPDTFVSAHRAGMLSPTGRCRPFSDDADGYVRSEGVGIVVLKRLADAQRDGDAILAVIRGSAENHGGRAGAITAPNPQAQAEVIARALAGIDPGTVGFVQAHGTGTRLGDPVEVRGLSHVYGRAVHGRPRCGLGSIKGNLGHLEAGAGVTGLLAVVLAMRHETLPPTLLTDRLNPLLELEDTPFFINREPVPWPVMHEGPKRGAVSSLGFGGVNAHVVIEAPPPEAPGDEPERVIVPLSANTLPALRSQARELAGYLREAGSIPLGRLAASLQTGRVALAVRAAAVVTSADELLSWLGSVGETRGGNRPVSSATPGKALRFSRERTAGAIEGHARLWREHRLDELVALWEAGEDVDWRALHGPAFPGRVNLPPRRFEGDHHWPQELGSPLPSGAEADGRVSVLAPVWRPCRAVRSPGARTIGILLGRIALPSTADGVTWTRVDAPEAREDLRFDRLSWMLAQNLRSLVADGLAGPTHVQVVTAEPWGAACHGLLRTAALEIPRLSTQLVLVPSSSEIPAGILATARGHSESLLRCVDGVLEARDWRPAGRQDGGGGMARPGDVWLMTGGNGGLARILAGHLVRQTGGSVTIVLVARTASSATAGEWISALQSLGATVLYRPCDVSRREEVRHLLRSIEGEHGKLDGVIHAAGLLRDGFLRNLDEPHWSATLAPKVAGWINLEEETRGRGVRALIALSSTAGVAGSAGQAAYATANAFMDTWAEATAGADPSRKVVSIAWPLWRDAGMTVSAARAAMLRDEYGMTPLESEAGLAALEVALSGDSACVWVRTPGEIGSESAPPREVVQTSENPGDLRGEITSRLRELFEQVVGRPNVDVREPLGNLALDSIIIVQLNHALFATYGGLPATLFFNTVTLSDVAAYLAEEHPEASARWVSGGTTPASLTPNPAAQPARSSSASRPRAVTGSGTEPIAIVGIAGRYPGARDPDELWSNVSNGVDSVETISRWPLEGFYEPDRGRAVDRGRSYCRAGGFLSDFSRFDYELFNIARKDALRIDPQERIFLETCWALIEDAGYSRAALSRAHSRRVGVFVGVTRAGHARHAPVRLSDHELLFPETNFASIANRVSFVLDLEGPSLAIDTMCSSSLVAVHTACEAIRAGECEVAIAGGVNLLLHPDDYVRLCQSQMLSSAGRCRSFGSGADGFVPGEGVGAVLLKPLSAALAAGDTVHGLIRGSHVNHGGRANGYTMPRPAAQAALIAGALERAGLDPGRIGYVEAHGSGTALGDPVEIEGLVAALSSAQPHRGTHRCAVGSVKSNIGHLEAAAGIAGLTRVVLQLRHRELAPTLHAKTLNPDLRLEGTCVAIQTERSAWPRPVLDGQEWPRAAGISSFGAGGVNAHVVVEEWEAPARTPAQPSRWIVPLSARTPSALHAAAERLRRWIGGKTADLRDVAFTLQTGRDAMVERLAVIAGDLAQLDRGLAAFLAGTIAGDVFTGRADAGPIATEPGRESLERLAALWVRGLEVDWNVFHSGLERRISLPTYPFEGEPLWLPEMVAAPVRPAPAPVLPAVPRRADIVSLIRTAVAQTLGIPENRIDDAMAFVAYGLDSILGTRLVHRLAGQLGRELPVSILYDHPTVSRLAEHLSTLGTLPAAAPAVRVEAASQDAVAIIGMSGRFAGSPDLAALWRHLESGRELVQPVRRWPLPAGGCRHGSFLDDIDCFDPLYFQISGVEADAMDPQQRIFLEEAWKALEDAGYAGEHGQPWGVYAGCWSGDYGEGAGPTGSGQALWGNMASVIPARVAYLMDLQGPAVAVDTACSSSLVAVDMAADAVRTGKVDLALAGGVYVQCTPRLFHLAGQAGMLSPSGRCRPFDAAADGFVPGEGCGVVVLKRLDRALADGDHIHGVIRGSGVNQDGATNGLTAPSAAAQQRLMEGVYERAGVSPASIQLVEAHGTGTSLGDPIEFEALRRVFQPSSRGAACALGSVKGNLGHTQYAAGIAGLLKVLLAMRHGRIPPSVHFDRPNPRIDLEGSPFFVPTRTMPWVSENHPRIGVVSAFGASGTNAHVVIEEAPRPVSDGDRNHGPQLFMLSGRTPEQLSKQLGLLERHLADNPLLSCADVAFTLSVGRRLLPHRFAAVAATLVELREHLRAALRGESHEQRFLGAAGGELSPALRRLGEDAFRRFRTTESPAAVREDLATFAELFVKGYPLPWPTLFEGLRCRRVPLPTTPLDRERHWHGAPLLEAPGEDTGIFLLTEVASPSGRCFTTVLTGTEFFLADHLVGEARVLPAVASLELARAAASRVLGGAGQRARVRLLDVVWGGRITVAQPVGIEIEIQEQHFKVRVAGGPISVAGSFESAEAGAEVVIPEIPKGDAPLLFNAAEVYRRIADAGIHHGPSMSALAEVCRYGDSATALLRLPATAPPAGAIGLHPSLLDAAIQATACLQFDEQGALPPGTAVPFSAAEVVEVRSCEPEMQVLLRRRGSGFDIYLCTLDGALCAFIGDLRSRVLFDDEVLAPVWEPASPSFGAVRMPTRIAPPRSPAEAAAGAASLVGATHLLWDATSATIPPLDSGAISNGAERYLLPFFWFIKAALERGDDAHAREVTVLTSGAQAIHPSDRVDPIAAALHGLVGAVAKEVPRWRLRVVDLAPGEAPDERVFSLPTDDRGDAWAWREGRWHRRHLVRVAPDSESSHIRPDGVYVVAGGAGGIGRWWTEQALRRGAAAVFWLGRRPLDAAIEAALLALRPLGTVDYLQADAADLPACRDAFARIRERYPAIHGVVNAAVLLRDGVLARMDETAFRDVLRAKADTSANLAAVALEGSPDFVLFFSSIQSFARVEGQANYAAASALQDALALSLARSAPARVVNWGYWSERGVVSSRFYQERMERGGMRGLDEAAAMSLLDGLVAGPQPQVAFLRTSAPGALGEINTSIEIRRVNGPAVPLLSGASPVELRASIDDARQALNWRGDTWKQALLGALNARLAPLDSRDIAPRYGPWLERSRTALEELEDARSEWRAALRSFAAVPQARPQVALVEAALEALPEILCGRLRATDVLFPKGSLDLAAAVYRDDPVAALFNRGITAVAAALPKDRSLRILEIGAGTGGATAAILAGLGSHPHVDYVYTDVSPAFQQHGREAFGNRRNVRLTFTRFDVEALPEAQGLEPGAFDLVVASNVLHATSDVRRALRHAKALLGRGGALILNELSAWDLFSHLTFGLLDGWWLAEDLPLRIPGSPALLPATWRRILSEEGFGRISFPLEAAHDVGQQLVLAESDGWIRSIRAASIEPKADPRTSSAPPEDPIAAAAPCDDECSLIERLRGVVAQTLRVPAAAIDPRAGFDRYGMDSLLVLQLANALQAVYPQVSARLVFEAGSVQGLAERLQASPWSSPLSEGQRGIWAALTLNPASTAYNVPLAFRVRRGTDPDRLRRALTLQLQRFPLLGARITGDEPRLEGSGRAAIEWTDAPRTGSLLDVLRADAVRPFDFQNGPLIRAIWTNDSSSEVFQITVHHLVFDGVSAANLIRSLMATYAALANGTVPALGPAGPPFRDFVSAEQALLDGPQGSRMRQYWSEHLVPPLPRLDLPLRQPLADDDPHQTGVVQVRLVESGPLLRRFATERQVSLATVFLAAWQVLLVRSTGERDVLVGLVVNARPEAFAESVGHFVNLLPTRVTLDPDQPFDEHVASLWHLLLGHLDHAAYPLPAMIRNLRLAAGRDGIPVVQTVFAFQNFRDAGVVIGTGSPTLDHPPLLTALEAVHQSGESAVDLEVYEEDTAFRLNLKYDVSRVHVEDARALAARLLALLDGIAAAPRSPIRRLPLLPDEERERILAWSRPATVSADERLIDHWFLEQARRTPQAVALTSGAVQLTYAALASAAGRLASELEAAGSGPNRLVGVLVEPSADLVVGIVGVLLSGAAYLPLDPAHPDERLEYILRDAGAGLLVCSPAMLERARNIASGEMKMILVCDDHVGVKEEDTHRSVDPRRSAEDLAYVIYTSGTTGQPKGVMVTHRNVTRLFQTTEEQCRFGPADTWVLAHSCAFDMSVWEVFGALLHGGRLVVPQESVVRAADAFHELVSREGVTVLNQTPSAFYQFIAADGLVPRPLALRLITLGGERLSPAALAPWFDRHGEDRPEIVNLYGITETTVHSTWHRVRAAEARERPGISRIGRPLRDLGVYLLNEARELVPIGAVGEIYVGGPGVTRGYIGRDALTAERFLPDSFVSGGTLYRSGDMARWLPDGTLESLGRRDRQVKIRGYRVEMDEVSSLLRESPDVAEAVALSEEDGPHGLRLVGFVVPRAGAETATLPARVRQSIATRAPAHLVPTPVRVVARLPLTVNGKLDRAALIATPHTTTDLADSGPDPRQIALCKVFTEALGLDELGPDDDLFEHGAHSLLLIGLVATIQQRLGVLFQVNDFYSAPTVRQLLRVADGQRRHGRYLDLRAEARLDRAIQPIGAAVAPSDVRKVLVTGGAGFVGRFLVWKMLSETQYDVTVLVLAASQEEADRSLFGTLEQYGLWRSEFAGRLTAVPGDLAKENLGIEAGRYRLLSEEIDSIYHLATFMNHYLDYENMHAVNVEGMNRIFRLACSGRQKRVEYISTINVFSTPHARHLIDESTSIDDQAQSSDFGYTSTKWVADKMAQIAMERGIPCNLIRLGLIIGDTARGRSESSQWFYKLVQVCLLLGVAYHDHDRLNMAVTPVDFAASAILEIGRSGETGRIFHLSNPHPLCFNRMITLYNEGGGRIELVDVDTFVEKARAFAGGRSALMRQFLDLYEEEIRLKFASGPVPGGGRTGGNAEKAANFLNTDFVSPIDSSRTMTWLSGRGLPFPCVDAAHVQKCFAFIGRSASIP